MLKVAIIDEVVSVWAWCSMFLAVVIGIVGKALLEGKLSLSQLELRRIGGGHHGWLVSSSHASGSVGESHSVRMLILMGQSP